MCIFIGVATLKPYNSNVKYQNIIAHTELKHKVVIYYK